MDENILNDIGIKIDKLNNVTVANNYRDSSNLNLLVQSLMSIQRKLLNDKEFTESTKYLSVLRKEIEYFLRKYDK